MRIRKLLPALLLFAAVSAQAQDEALDVAFTWKLEGDTAKNFKVSLEPNIEIDRSSPEALVRTFMALSDGRAEAVRGRETLDAKINEIERAELKNPLAMLDESLRGLPVPENSKIATFGSDWELTVLDPKDDRIIERDRNGKLILGNKEDRFVEVVSQKTEKDPQTGTQYKAVFWFRCHPLEESGAIWELSGILPQREYIDSWISPADMPLPAPERPTGTTYDYDYDPGFGSLAYLEFSLQKTAVKFEGEVHAAVRTFCTDLLMRRLTLRTELCARIWRAYLATVEPLMSAEYVSQLKLAASERDEFAGPLNHSFQTFKQLEQSDLGDGRVGVLIQKDDLFQTSWWFELKPDGDDWHIDAIKRRFIATRVRDGVQVETLRDADSFWEVAKMDAPTIMRTLIFLPR